MATSKALAAIKRAKVVEAMAAGLIGSYGGDNVVPLRPAVDGE